MNTCPTPATGVAPRTTKTDLPADMTVAVAVAATPPGAYAWAENAAVHSTDLFKGQRTLAISHNGAVYRLQATRQGKLILTK